ncbi:BlaI/MecI/CopY family transcriptional regulator [Singulisphaera rosea]
MARPPSTQPTDGELELLKILWETGPAGLGQVHAMLQERRGVAITTVATMLKMMLAKDLVRREDGPRGYLWSASVSRQKAVSGLVGKLLNLVFDGSARRLVAHMIDQGQIDDEEREEILKLLRSRAEAGEKDPKKGRNR